LPDWFLVPPDIGATAADWDNDGLDNDEEERLHTDPYSWDTDNGGENDGAEVTAGRRPLDPQDDVPPKSACIPDGARNWDGSSPDEEPLPARELAAVLPDRIAGETITKTSMVGLPRRYGFFNYFWDALLLCAGGQPEDLSHAIGFRGVLPGLAILAVRVEGSDMDKLGRDLLVDLERGGHGRRATLPQRIEGRDVAFLLDADAQGLTFASYVADDTLFLMTGMSVTDSGFWPGSSLDPEHVREAVLALPPP